MSTHNNIFSTCNTCNCIVLCPQEEAHVSFNRGTVDYMQVEQNVVVFVVTLNELSAEFVEKKD